MWRGAGCGGPSWRISCWPKHERSILLETCRTLDACADLQAVLDAGGVFDEAYGGRPNPVLAELRQQRVAAARLLAAMRLPAGVEDDGKGGKDKVRSQRRAVRGVHSVDGLA